MTPARRLSWRGFQRKQSALAQEILADYPLRVDSLRLVSSATNFIYAVSSGEGRFILRLAFPGWRTYENARAECAWLAALARDTDIPVPRILPTAAGEPIARRGERHAVLMTRLPGMLLARRVHEGNVYKMGELFAKLHRHAGSWARPADFPAAVFNRFISRCEPEALFAEERLPDYAPSDLVVVRRMAERVNAHYAALDRADLRPIHCDLWHDNIKLHRGFLAPFDFEDTILGYRLHDIAMAMLDLAEDFGLEPYYERLLPAFRRGYEALLDWPEGELELLQLGRMLWKLNWTADRRPERFSETAAFTADLCRRYERSGRLEEPLH